MRIAHENRARRQMIHAGRLAALGQLSTALVHEIDKRLAALAQALARDRKLPVVLVAGHGDVAAT